MKKPWGKVYIEPIFMCNKNDIMKKNYTIKSDNQLIQRRVKISKWKHILLCFQ